MPDGRPSAGELGGHVDGGSPAARSSASARRLALAARAAEARSCRRCPQLAAARTTVVLGTGDPDADLLLVGQAPGRNEDRQGVPIAGAPAALLFELLAGAGIAREDVYVTTVLRCRPPDNRDPLPDEVAACARWLTETVELVRPRVVAALGGFATKLLRGDPAPIRAVHGRDEIRTIGSRPVRLVPLFDPAAALYDRGLVDVLRRDVARIPALLDAPAPAAGDAPPAASGRALGAEADGADDVPQLPLF